MRIIKDEALTYGDVCLVPQLDSGETRDNRDVTTRLTRDREMRVPFVAANMDSVIGTDLARVLIAHGSFPIFHRFVKNGEQIAWVEEFGANAFFSCGTSDPKMVEVAIDLARRGAGGICVDVAHGHSVKALNAIRRLKGETGVQVIGGNVCTPEGTLALIEAGADAVKVGIGPGAACTTRRVTGFGVPQLTAVIECSAVGKAHGIPIIADGGIEESADVAKALAAGASSVMLGKLFARTEESAAEKVEVVDSGIHVRYRGQASKHFRAAFYGKSDKRSVAEGVDFLVPVSGSAGELIDQLVAALQSAISYAGANNIAEFKKNAVFRRVTHSNGQESGHRGV